MSETTARTTAQTAQTTTRTTTHRYTCPLCEATCGLLVEVGHPEGAAPRVVQARGNPDDVFSKGFACPKGLAIGELQHDPDRLRAPLVDGEETTWEHAWSVVAERLGRVVTEHGRGALGLYLGNPNVHNLAGQLYVGAVAKAAGTRNIFSASTTDQMPKQVATTYMFGDPLTVPIPDVDRTDLLVVLGADPLTSNGSLWTAPDMPGRLRALRKRGGRLVVVDPRTSRTAKAADTHLAIRPGTDVFLLAAVAHVLLTEGLADVGPHVGAHLEGLDALPEVLAPFTPDAVAPVVGLPAEAVTTLARDLAAAPSAAVYGRIGTTTVRFGTLTSWLVDVVNTLTGNLDAPGGVMFPLAAAGQRNSAPTSRARSPRFGRWTSAERGLPEVLGELPTAALAEEILGGHVRGLVTIAGNPALSAPDGGRLGKALDGLDVLVCVDLYRTETAARADVVLPVPGPLARPHYDLTFNQFACRNTAHFSPVVLPAEGDVEPEWRTLCRLAGVLQTLAPQVDPDAVDALVVSTLLGQHVAAEGSPVHGREVADLVAQVSTAADGSSRTGDVRMLDALLRLGPYGDGFGVRPDGLTLDRLAAAPDGLDLGPLEPRLPGVLRTPSGRVELAPAPVVADVARLRTALDEARAAVADGGLVLVGRRHLRSNNSWAHNLPSLVTGTNTCTLHIHPDDAASRGIVDGAPVAVTSSAGSVETVAEVTDRIRAGVVSLPHGWGHAVDGAGLSVARTADGDGGANVNVLVPPEVDPLSGTAVLNGYAVEVAAV
ncbi:MAG: molybdopterin-dependent oxidoreductase [Actinobacteria bacterium]|nr:molybdopterin-dependent oxidoreductase [Actinomycetota bacterium]